MEIKILQRIQLAFARCCVACVLIALCVSPAFSDPTSDLSPSLGGWLKFNSTIDTFSANFNQSRRLAGWKTTSLSSGKFWVKRPHQLRWETGSPPRTIFTFSDGRMCVYYPREMRVEQHTFESLQRNRETADGKPIKEENPGLEVISAIEKCFAKSLDDLERGSVLDLALTERGLLRIRLDRRSGAPAGKHSVQTVVIVCDPKQAGPIATELYFFDGGIIKTEILRPRLNEVLGESLFNPIIPGEVVDPDK